MSRTLSKILVICALVVLIPLTMVGTAFAAYYSVDAIVNITIYTINSADPGSTDALAAVRYNGQDITRNKFQISQSHLDSITLEARNVGYDFIGWFEGEEYTEEMNDQAKLGDGNKLTVKMENGKSYIAVFDVIKYTLSWQYTEDPDDNLSKGTIVSTDPDSGEQGPTEYVYGQELKRLDESKATQYRIDKNGGWCLYQGNAANKNAHYSRAEFKNEFGGDFAENERELTLTYDWIQKGMFTVNYYKYEDRFDTNKQAIATENIVKENASSYVYATEFASLMADGKVTEAEAGYKWEGFKRATNPNSYDLTDVTSDNFTTDDFVDSVDIYVGSTLINYTAQLSVEAGATYGGTEITFTVNDIENAQSKLAPFFDETKYTKEYFFYEFSGIKVASGNVLTQGKVEDLKSALNTFIEEHPHEEQTLEFTAVFETEYKVAVSGNQVYYKYDLDDPVYNEAGTEIGSFYLEQGGVDSKTTLGAFLKINDAHYYNAEHSASRKEVVFNEIAFGGTYSIQALTRETTVAEFLVKMNDVASLQKYLHINNETNLITITYKFTASFALAE